MKRIGWKFHHPATCPDFAIGREARPSFPQVVAASRATIRGPPPPPKRPQGGADPSLARPRPSVKERKKIQKEQSLGICSRIFAVGAGLLCVGLDFLALLVGLLDQGQLGVRVGHGQIAVGRVPGAVQHQGPLFDVAALQHLRVEAHLKHKSTRVLDLCVEILISCSKVQWL